jgi:glycosyltransferase involved in cell wall biosynthesis
VVQALARLIKDRDVDILHMHLYHASLYGRIAALLSGRRRPRTVVSMLNVYSRVKPLRVFINRRLVKHTDLFIAGSDAVKEDVVKYDHAPAERVYVLPYGVDVGSFAPRMPRGEAKARLGLNEDDFVLGNVGRLVDAKGQRHLLNAYSIMKRMGKRPRLVIVGSGPLEQDLKGQAASLGIAEDVLFTGARLDLPELYNAMDIYVMPSLWEGSPLALISAMSAGLPSVVTRVGGMPDLMDNGGCGVIVPPKDEEALAGAIMALMDDPGRMSYLGGLALARAHTLYGNAGMVSKLEGLYEGLF